MTSQTKHFIDLTDIIALRFQCQREQCGAIFTVPLSSAVNTNKLKTCPNCDRPWLAMAHGSVGERALETFSSAFLGLMAVMENEGLALNKGFSLAVEVKAEKAES